MILANNRKAVVVNIKRSVLKHEFHKKAELHDPVLSLQESEELIQRFWHNKKKLPYRLLNKVIDGLFCVITPIIGYNSQISEHSTLKHVSKAIVTCNHYNQLDILPVKKLAMKYHRRLYFVVKDTNLVMHFPIGLLVRNADSIPVNGSLHYLGEELLNHFKQSLKHNAWILIYSEQELWFNYRKPRPLKKGAYYYAAKLQVPIISCFAEIQDRQSSELFHRSFHKTKIILHVLPTIYPNPHLSIKEDTLRMRDLDYRQKVRAYEKAYHCKLNYSFSLTDIAGLKK